MGPQQHRRHDVSPQAISTRHEMEKLMRRDPDELEWSASHRSGRPPFLSDQGRVATDRRASADHGAAGGRLQIVNHIGS
jgi:hypothetical protein